VEEDVGRDIAMKVAAQLVMFFKRPGGQMQFSRRGESLPAGRSALQEVQRFIAANPSSDHSVTKNLGSLSTDLATVNASQKSRASGGAACFLDVAACRRNTGFNRLDHQQIVPARGGDFDAQDRVLASRVCGRGHLTCR
jgi:hypothetical protein